MFSGQRYVADDELNDAVVAFMRAADRLERRLKVAAILLGSEMLLTFVTELLIVRKVGL